MKTPDQSASEKQNAIGELQQEVNRQREFVRWLHSVTALPHILGGAQRKLAELEALEEAERQRVTKTTQSL